MRVAELMGRSAVGMRPEQTVAEAAGLMEQAGVGSLAVVDDAGRLVGIVTDRDLVRRVMARGLPPDARIDDVMSTPVVSIDADDDIREAFRLFRVSPVRRLAVMRAGRFAGMVSIDDLLIQVAGELKDLSRPVAGEVESAQRDSPVPATA